MFAIGVRGTMMLLEDYNDLADWAEALGRAYPRMKWVDELVDAAEERTIEGLI
jgi:hypothetical protein